MAPLLLLAAVAGPALPATPKSKVAAVAPCPPKRNANEVVVCGQSDEDPPYRLPKTFRDQGFRVDGAADSVSRERHKLMDAGAAMGTGSCSSVGPGGWTGCMVRQWRADEQQRGFRSPSEVQDAEEPR
jgi:hypothetical protein